MTFEYFQDTDTLSLAVRAGEVDTTEELSRNLLIDYGDDCCGVLHLDIRNARQTLYDFDPSKFQYILEENGRHLFKLTSDAMIGQSDVIKTDEHPSVEIRHKNGKWTAIMVRD